MLLTFTASSFAQNWKDTLFNRMLGNSRSNESVITGSKLVTSLLEAAGTNALYGTLNDTNVPCQVLFQEDGRSKIVTLNFVWEGKPVTQALNFTANKNYFITFYGSAGELAYYMVKGSKDGEDFFEIVVPEAPVNNRLSLTFNNQVTCYTRLH